MIGPIISGLVFSTLIIILSVFKPNACRIFLGFFFLAMGLGVNLYFVINQPYFVFEYGMGAWLPLYRALTESIIGLNPVLFGVLLIIFEVLVGLALLGKKNRVSLGIFSASLFILLLIPLYYSQIAWSFSVVGILFLLRNKYENNVLEMIRAKFKKDDGGSPLS